MRRFVIVICLALLVVGCGDSEPTMSEYATEVERLLLTMNGEIDALDAEIAGQTSTLEDVREFWGAKLAARREFVEGLESVEPPEEAVEMHKSALGIIKRLTAVDEAVAELVGTMESDAELATLLESPEFLATEVVDAEAIAMCQAAQGDFDATADGDVFADVPWIPSELREVVIVFFGCTKEERGVAP